jgi:hypothetical protein
LFGFGCSVVDIGPFVLCGVLHGDLSHVESITRAESVANILSRDPFFPRDGDRAYKMWA